MKIFIVIWIILVSIFLIGMLFPTVRSFIFSPKEATLWRYYISNVYDFEVYEKGADIIHYRSDKHPSVELICLYREYSAVYKRNRCVTTVYNKYYSKKLAKLLLTLD